MVCLSANITDPAGAANPCAVIGSLSDRQRQVVVQQDLTSKAVYALLAIADSRFVGRRRAEPLWEGP